MGDKRLHTQGISRKLNSKVLKEFEITYFETVVLCSNNYAMVTPPSRKKKVEMKKRRNTKNKEEKKIERKDKDDSLPQFLETTGIKIKWKEIKEIKTKEHRIKK